VLRQVPAVAGLAVGLSGGAIEADIRIDSQQKTVFQLINGKHHAGRGVFRHERNSSLGEAVSQAFLGLAQAPCRIEEGTPQTETVSPGG
jgi:hypothetical protein